MNALKNKVQLIGYLGADPEIVTTSGDKKLAKFRLATNESYKNADGQIVKETQWHSLVAWGKVATLAEKLLSKGTEVLVEGKLINRSYTDKAGATKYISEIQVFDLLLLRKKD